MFGFPAQQKGEGFKYSRNFLRTVVFQVKFPEVVNFAARQAEVQELIKPLFSITQNDTPTFQLSLAEGTPVFTEADGIPGLMEFQDSARQKQFTVTKDTVSLTISGTSYVNFQEIQPDLEASIYAVIKLLGVKQVNRLAIRKINIISAKVKDPSIPVGMPNLLQQVFNTNIIQSTLVMPSVDNVYSTVTNTRFIEGDDNLVLIYGLLPKQEFEPEARHLLLDIDLFRSGNCSAEDIKDNFSIINNGIYDTFVWCLNPSFMSVLA
jgi:uncharacterized protein (TIGR04255 family)